MRLQRLVMPVTEAVSWTVVDHSGEPIPPIETFRVHLTALERSPETVRAYAISLKLWFEFLGLVGVTWDAAGIDDVSSFVAWLRAPAPPAGVVQSGTRRRSPATVNRYLAGVFGFYDFHARRGVVLTSSLVAWRRTSRGSYKPFLCHATAGNPVPIRPVKLAVPQRRPRTLSVEQVSAILAACEHLRDRFLVALLSETGMRIGQALGLRHCDFVSRACQVHIVPRDDNANGARAKTSREAVVPISVQLVRLYSAYTHTEYGDMDSDYVFVNLWSEPRGQPLRYQAVHRLAERLQARSGVSFTWHVFRHTFASNMIRNHVPVEIVAKLLTQRSSATSGTYVHLNPADLRDALRQARVWDDPDDPDDDQR
jgi:integrase/recombinase XerD